MTPGKAPDKSSPTYASPDVESHLRGYVALMDTPIMGVHTGQVFEQVTCNERRKRPSYEP